MWNIIINLPGGHINEPSLGQILFSYVPLSSLLSVSDPWKAFWADMASPIKDPQPRLVRCFWNIRDRRTLAGVVRQAWRSKTPDANTLIVSLEETYHNDHWLWKDRIALGGVCDHTWCWAPDPLIPTALTATRPWCVGTRSWWGTASFHHTFNCAASPALTWSCHSSKYRKLNPTKKCAKCSSQISMVSVFKCLSRGLNSHHNNRDFPRDIPPRWLRPLDAVCDGLKQQKNQSGVSPIIVQD